MSRERKTPAVLRWMRENGVNLKDALNIEMGLDPQRVKEVRRSRGNRRSSRRRLKGNSRH